MLHIFFTFSEFPCLSHNHRLLKNQACLLSYSQISCLNPFSLAYLLTNLSVGPVECANWRLLSWNLAGPAAAGARHERSQSRSLVLPVEKEPADPQGARDRQPRDRRPGPPQDLRPLCRAQPGSPSVYTGPTEQVKELEFDKHRAVMGCSLLCNHTWRAVSTVTVLNSPIVILILLYTV